MKICVTGGSGFIGSNLIHQLVKQKHQVLNLDIETSAAHPFSLKKLKSSSLFTHKRVDISQQQAILPLLDSFQPEAVIHLASENQQQQLAKDASQYLVPNTLGTAKLLEAVSAYWSQLPKQRQLDFRFLHSSTAAVFYNLQNPRYRISESDPQQPSNLYCLSKASANNLVQLWQQDLGLPTLITYASETYGPRQLPHHFIPDRLIRALKQQPLKVTDESYYQQDWLYVDDHVEAIIQVLMRGQPGESYLISAELEVTALELLRQLCHLLDALRPQKTSYLNLVCYQDSGLTYNTSYQFDASKLRKQLGWQPQETLTSGLTKTLNWYLDNPDWVSWWLDQQQQPRKRRVIQGI